MCNILGLGSGWFLLQNNTKWMIVRSEQTDSQYVHFTIIVTKTKTSDKDAGTFTARQSIKEDRTKHGGPWANQGSSVN